MTSSADAGTVLAQRLIPFSLLDPAKILHHQANLGLIGLFREYWINRSIIGQGEILKPHEEGSYHTRAETRADRFKEDIEMMSLGELVNWVQAHDFSPESTAVICVGDRKYAITLQLTPLQEVDGE
jgi:hypothetical protein